MGQIGALITQETEMAGEEAEEDIKVVEVGDGLGDLSGRYESSWKMIGSGRGACRRGTA